MPFAILLLLCGTWTYRPALNRVFAEDQIPYFAELDGETSLGAGLRLADYVVARQYARGDEVLYRPLLFAAMAVENTVLGRDFRAWNALSLALHLLVAYLLFEVLWRMQRTLLACGFALLFALLASNFEQVSWNHLVGYMLGYGLLLAALWAAREMAQDSGGAGASAGWAWAYALAMTGAMLTYEIAVAASLGVVAHGMWQGYRKPPKSWRRLAAAWSAPILIYAVLYAFHVGRCTRFWDVNPQAEPVRSWFSWTLQWLWLMWQWIVRILLPDQCRIGGMPFSRSMWMSPVGWGGMESLLPLASWLGLLVCLRRGFAGRHLKDVGPFGVLLAGLILAYAGMNLIGRPYAQYVTYYLYFPALLGAVLLYASIDFPRVGRRARAGALAFVLLLALAHGRQTYRTSCQVREINGPAARYGAWLERSLHPHLADPAFTFSIAGAPPELDPEWPLSIGYPDQGIRVSKPISQWLYGKRCAPAAPADTWAFPGLDALPR